MVAAMILAVGVMLVFAGPVGDFVERHPTIKMLALSFLILIGVMLGAEGFGKHVEKGYVYFAMAFSLSVELLNLRVRRDRAAPVKLHGPGEASGSHGPRGA
jgi:predicted tellurium resistance membrane protein TerC